jgi:hypothetical protein
MTAKSAKSKHDRGNCCKRRFAETSAQRVRSSHAWSLRESGKQRNQVASEGRARSSPPRTKSQSKTNKKNFGWKNQQSYESKRMAQGTSDEAQGKERGHRASRGRRRRKMCKRRPPSASLTPPCPHGCTRIVFVYLHVVPRSRTTSGRH